MYQYTDEVLHQILLNIPDYVFWKDLDLIYRGCNYNFARLAGGKKPEDIVGKSDKELPWGEFTADIYRQEDRQVIETKKPILHKEVPLITDKNEERTLSVSKVPMFGQDHVVIGVLCIFRDITEKRRSEQTLDNANRSKTQFINAINQLVRTQLTGVLGVADVMQLNATQVKQKEDAGIICESGSGIIPILDKALYYLDLEQGRLKPFPQQFNLSLLIESIIEDHRPYASEKNTIIRLHYESGTPTDVIGDANLVQVVINTLIYNAVRFTQRGNVDITVHLVDSKETINICVSDTGQGIAKEMWPYLFNLFDLDRDNPQIAFSHAGLNLSIAKKIVSVLGGEIHLSDKKTQGAQFGLFIPFASIGKKSPLPRSLFSKHAVFNRRDETVTLRDSNQPIRVLIVEDNRLNRIVLKRLFEEIKHCELVMAETVQEALDLLDDTYDLILLDIELPDGSGTEVAKAARKRYAKQTPPIIAVTAHCTEEESMMLTANGIDDVVEKPIRFETLQDILKFFVYETRHEDE